MMNQCQSLSETNLSLSQDLQKAKLMIETLEAVIMMLYTHPSANEVSLAHHGLTDREPSGEDRADSSAA